MTEGAIFQIATHHANAMDSRHQQQHVMVQQQNREMLLRARKLTSRLISINASGSARFLSRADLGGFILPRAGSMYSIFLRCVYDPAERIFDTW